MYVLNKKKISRIKKQYAAAVMDRERRENDGKLFSGRFPSFPVHDLIPMNVSTVLAGVTLIMYF